MSWHERTLRPLYENNVVVSMVTNSLVPTLQELVLEPEVLATAQRDARASENTKYSAEYGLLRERLKNACVQSRLRDAQTTPRFRSMRDGMLEYISNEQVQESLVMLFVCVASARVALRLMTERLTDALEKHDDIMTSDDVPMSAFGL